ncbi:helix-turn-helix transcriptional regulator [Vibrio salinus]|uniref:helix-turn-helix transcriptional regulator n=1 Tax=Vibrio salinus TaxID=2899784 RepID=UPI001E4A54B7|nr:helix-turn-helix transcriptional regulator [Vibrio salinus]MCE0496094.1 helix-turn-helix domain-containing protein [Vibrio salinus]
MHCDNLKLLGDFLRAKRERIQPEMIGLPRLKRTRSKGLRRDDVAYHSGISTIWYSKIERGQVSGISTQVLADIAETLQLTKSEYNYICNLASSIPEITVNSPRNKISDHTFQLLSQINPLPALLQNDYLDIIACNESFSLMIGFPMETLPPDERNYLHLTIMNPDWQQFLLIDNEDKLKIQISRMAGFLRNTLASRSNDKILKQKIDSFVELSPTFKQAWQNNSVLQPEEISYIHKHASLGKITLDKQIWWNVNGDSNSRLNIYHPQNETDKQRLSDVLKTLV